MAVDPFVALNAAIRMTFGSRTPVTYYPSTGATAIGQSFTVDAVLDTPSAEDHVLDGTYKIIWFDGNDPALPVIPTEGDMIGLPSGALYIVQYLNVDAENGVTMQCRLKNRGPNAE